MDDQGFVSLLHRRTTAHRPLSRTVLRADDTKSRACVEYISAEQKARIGLFACTIGPPEATTTIGFATLVCHLKSLIALIRAAMAVQMSFALWTRYR